MYIHKKAVYIEEGDLKRIREQITQFNGPYKYDSLTGMFKNDIGSYLDDDCVAISVYLDSITGLRQADTYILSISLYNNLLIVEILRP